MKSSSPRRRALVQELESLQRSGVQAIPCVSVPAANTAELADECTEISPRPAPAIVDGPLSAVKQEAMSSPALPANQCAAALQALAGEVASCTACQALADSRTQTVFGVGNPNARLVFFGEAPGADEDKQGEPFVGRAGQLLTKIIEACTLTREDVYILNVLKCRPPGNRNPTPEEAQNCRPFFERQLEIIRPEFICCLGAIATTTLLETTQSIGRLRGRFHDWKGVRVMATYHPAYLLRNPAAKRLVWEDMQMLMKEMGIQLPK